MGRAGRTRRPARGSTRRGCVVCPSWHNTSKGRVLRLGSADCYPMSMFGGSSGNTCHSGRRRVPRAADLPRAGQGAGGGAGGPAGAPRRGPRPATGDRPGAGGCSAARRRPATAHRIRPHPRRRAGRCRRRVLGHSSRRHAGQDAGRTHRLPAEPAGPGDHGSGRYCLRTAGCPRRAGYRPADARTEP